MSHSSADSSAPVSNNSSKKELYAVCAALFALGIAFSTWASRVPDVRTAAFLTATTLGYVLLIRGFGTLVMMPVVAISINYFGAKKTALISGLVVAVSLIPISYSSGWISLAILLFLVGAGSSSYNIAVNALGAKVELESGKSHMSKIHSWFGVGNLSGALLGTLAKYFSVSTNVHFGAISIFLLATVFITYRFLPNDTPHPNVVRPKFKWPHGGLVAIGLIAFLASSIESSVNNWVAIFFSDHLKVNEGLVPVGYTMFAGALLGMRLFGDRLKMKFGAKKLIVSGSLLATCGLITAVLAPNIVVAGIGFFIAGSGIALNFPMIFSAAGREGAVALTSVATFGYVGGMVSQPLMGMIVTEFETVGGFSFIATLTFLISIIAWRSRLLKA